MEQKKGKMIALWVLRVVVGLAFLAAGLQDQRQAGKVDHMLRDLVAQRVFSCVCI
jgi:hypothetical protein